ncbi:hypothetical protein AN958_06280 [Leucoagaricus sp. SymC.cos]|nr:hypothetical protein AN958_06280 [Leucoagaricus sp. SymC.cos]
MSDSATPQDFSFAARDVILNMTLMETFGDGIYSAIFWFTMYMLVFGKREKGTRLSFSTFIVLVPMYILSMIHLAIRWFTLRYAFVVKGDTSDDILNGFLQQPRWCSVLSVVSFSLMSLIADFVAVWRCWMIWNRSWKVALLPILIVLAGVAFCIISAIYQIDPNSNLASDNFNKFAQSSLIYFCLSLASTVISTTLIQLNLFLPLSRQYRHFYNSHRLSNYRRCAGHWLPTRESLQESPRNHCGISCLVLHRAHYLSSLLDQTSSIELSPLRGTPASNSRAPTRRPSKSLWNRLPCTPSRSLSIFPS